MEGEKVYTVSITQIKILKPFLKLTARNLKGKDTEKFKNLKYLFDLTIESKLSVGDICIVKLNSFRYERSKVLELRDQQVLIHLIDAGSSGNIHINQLRPLSDIHLRKIQSQCFEFIVAKVMLLENSNTEKVVKRLNELLLQDPLEMALIDKDSSGAYVDLRIKDASLVDDIIPNDKTLHNYLGPISLEEQKRKMSQKVDERLGRLAVNEHSILPSRITAYDKGVNSFYVRFKSKSNQCREFISNVQAMRENLIPLRLVPSREAINTQCIAIYENRLYRSRIVQVNGNIPRNSVTIQLLETGERLTINTKTLFKMPDEISSVPPFAKHMKLASFEIDPPLDEQLVDFYFEYITNQKVLDLKFVEDNGETSAIQSCELFENGENIVDKIRSWNYKDFNYPPQPLLQRGVMYQAMVVHGKSPDNFFIQIIDESHENKLKELEKMNEIVTPNLKSPSESSACLISYKSRLQRAKVISTNKSFYAVQFVDIGKKDDFAESELRIMLEGFTKMPPLAYRCALEEFDNEIVCSQTVEIFESILDSCDQFTLTVHDINEKQYVVDLQDPFEKKSVAEMMTEQLNRRSRSDWSHQVTPQSLFFSQKRMINKPNDTVHQNTLVAQSDTSNIWEFGQESIVVHTSQFHSPNVEEAKAKNSSEIIWNDDNAEVFRQKTPPPLDSRRSLNMEVISENFEKSPDIVASSSGFSSLQSARSDKSRLVRITAVASAEDFTVQSVNKEKRYLEYQKELQIAANSLLQLEKIDVGEFCLAFHPFDKMWCRAQMIDAETADFLVTVRCVDDGTTFCITDKRELKFTSLEFLVEPFFGKKCSLAIKINEKRENFASQHLMRLMKNQIRSRLVTKHSNLHFVELMVEGKDLADTFIESGLGKKIFVVPNVPVIINHIDSLENFSVQLKDSCENMRYIDEQMSAYKWREVSAPKNGMLVLALFSIDKTWHRARIVSKEERGFNVYLVDCGYSIFVNEIGAIDDATLAGIPEIAVKCSLLLPASVKSQENLAEQKFRELVKSGKHTFNVEMIEPTTKCAIVQLFMDKEDILEKLISVNISQLQEKYNEEIFKVLFE